MIRVTILDMQPIDPPVGGGRLRLLGLYHGLGPEIRATYVGSYDWPGERFRRHMLSEGLEEIDVPLSEQHFCVADLMRKFVSDMTIIDVTFPVFGHLSSTYLARAKQAVKAGDVVVFGHPWVFPLVEGDLDPGRQLIVYDAHNCEAVLRADLIGGTPFGDEVVKQVALNERQLARKADLILACSGEDAEMFRELYQIDAERIVEVPNGVLISRIRPPSAAEKQDAKRRLGLEGFTTIFIGSAYAPNAEAARFIGMELAPNLGDVQFVICGGVGDLKDVRACARGLRNVRISGSISESDKSEYLRAADVALNPMFSGSGTNIKMFDFMAAGLPVLSTRAGARGIVEVSEAGVLVETASEFERLLRGELRDPVRRHALGQANRRRVEERFAWEDISPRLGALLQSRLDEKHRSHAGGSPGRPPAADSARAGAIRACLDDDGSRRGARRVTVMSSFLIRCGIAEYTAHFCNALRPHVARLNLLANTSAALQAAGGHVAPFDAAEALWAFDNVKWVESRVDVSRIVDVLSLDRDQFFNVQYHPAFFGSAALVELLVDAARRGVATSATLHNSATMDDESIRAISATGAWLFVHPSREARRLRGLGITRVTQLPLGMMEVPTPDVKATRERLGLRRGPIIGCFGFLRPHKGVAELIRAAAILRSVYPDLLVLGLNALYPSGDSEAYRDQCLKLVEELSLESCVRLETSFLDTKTAIAFLQACDVTVLPYHEVNEGASAAASFCLSAKRPVITSRSSTFDDVRPVSYPLESVDPEAIAMAVANVLSNRDVRASLERAVEDWVAANSWTAVARRFVQTISGGDREPVAAPSSVDGD